jgi:hypothetical protein
MTIFEASREEGSLAPDGDEVLELRFVSLDEARTLALAARVPEVLDALRQGACWYRVPDQG